jgi:quinol monooxygenase YgiN
VGGARYQSAFFGIPADFGRCRNDEPRGGLMAAFELSAHMTVRPGRLDGFKKQAAEIIRLTKEQDTQTIRYDWFLTDDGAECEVRELYASPQGLIEHKAHIGAALKELFEQYADNTS